MTRSFPLKIGVPKMIVKAKRIILGVMAVVTMTSRNYGTASSAAISTAHVVSTKRGHTHPKRTQTKPKGVKSVSHVTRSFSIVTQCTS